jgi:hypothetical protein
MPIPRQVQIRRPKDFCGHLSDSDADDRNDNELLIRWTHRYSTVRSITALPSVVAKGRRRTALLSPKRLPSFC